MSAALEEKKKLVEELKEKIGAAKSIVIVDYKGLSVFEDTEPAALPPFCSIKAFSSLRFFQI